MIDPLTSGKCLPILRMLGLEAKHVLSLELKMYLARGGTYLSGSYVEFSNSEDSQSRNKTYDHNSFQVTVRRIFRPYKLGVEQIQLLLKMFNLENCRPTSVTFSIAAGGLATVSSDMEIPIPDEEIFSSIGILDVEEVV